ncbi:MAG: HAMP domain-containing histidine kinase [Bacteroidales bacterium]|nr:HAMP domain-containing histidine kinase [Bacteroidales bacterium]MDE6802933.1 HAMP domain-containing histidine kinase [Muribaculaceae bacterium]MDE6831516.1 HAMP domain-containing histidine kinase [Muribaculaceae bacterium]
MKRILLFSLALLTAASSLMASVSRSQHSLDSIRYELATASTPDDSIRLYYDIFDLTPREKKKYIAQELYEMGVRHANAEVQLDMLCQLTLFNLDNDTLRAQYQKKAEQMSPSSRQRMTALYISVVNDVQAARYSKDPASKKRLRRLINRATIEDGASVYTRLEVAMTLCAFLDGKGRNAMLSKYLDEAETYISRLSYRLNALDTYFMAQASANYTAVGDFKKAIAIDKKLIETFDSAETKYNTQGRQFRNYDYERYNAYRRILLNFPELTPQEVEYYYGKVQEMARRDETQTVESEFYQRPTIYYYLATGRYHEAIPLLFKQLRDTDQHLSPTIRLNMINYLIEAAEKTGDKEALNEAYKMYRDVKEDNDLYDDQQEFLDMQFCYETNTLNLERSQLAVDRMRSDRENRIRAKKSDRVILYSALLVVLILIVALAFMYRTGLRMKKLNARSAKDNAALKEERDTLRRTQGDLMRASERVRRADQQKEEFINNVSNEIQTPVNAIVEYSQLIVDCIDDDRHRYLDRFAAVVKLNAELLSTLVGDVLNLASHDKGTFKIEKRPVSVQDLSTVAIDSIKDRIPEGVKVVNEVAQETDILVDTDGKRVAQVLMNLLSNSAKFTHEGSITLSGSLSDDGEVYTFAVTDTGIGIPKGKEEVIFERFKKLSKYSQGVGLGLPVGRMIATLLGGELKVDTTYAGRGARFIFTFPVK